MNIHVSRERIAAVVLMGCLLAWYRLHDYAKWSQRGRQEFVTYQLHRFDTYMIHPRPLLVTLLSSLIAVVMMLGFYELSAAAFRKILSPEASQRSTVPGNAPSQLT
jgi:hypothetical protein